MTGSQWGGKQGMRGLQVRAAAMHIRGKSEWGLPGARVLSGVARAGPPVEPPLIKHTILSAIILDQDLPSSHLLPPPLFRLFAVFHVH